MATQVLRSHDLFADRRIRHHPRPFRRRKTPTVDDNSASPRSNKRRSPKRSKKEEVPSGGLVNGQVTLLKRGEPLDLSTLKVKPNATVVETKPIDVDLVVLDTPEKTKSKLGLPKKTKSILGLPKQLRTSVAPTPPNSFAGSAISSSPSPRALPLPSFFNRIQPSVEPVVVESASRDLRRMLRLE